MMGDAHWEVVDKTRTAALLEVRDWLRAEAPDLVQPFDHEFNLEEY